jgi:hypothetical protein
MERDWRRPGVRRVVRRTTADHEPLRLAGAPASHGSPRRYPWRNLTSGRQSPPGPGEHPRARARSRAAAIHPQAEGVERLDRPGQAFQGDLTDRLIRAGNRLDRRADRSVTRMRPSWGSPDSRAATLVTFRRRPAPCGDEPVQKK